MNDTKADVLNYLKAVINTAKIDNFFCFTYSEWKNNPDIIINKIRNNLFSDWIIIRSSAITEISHNFSLAGYFLSVPHIPKLDTKAIKKSIKLVFDSFKKHGRILSDQDSIIVQEYVMNSRISGVLINRDYNNNPSYCLINYDSSSNNTATVTSGLNCNTVRIFRYSNKINKPWDKLINLMRELENIYSHTNFIIEFSIDANNILHLFQLRFFTNINIKELKKIEDTTFNQIKLAQKCYCKIKHKTKHEKEKVLFLSDMADWNPAEMIGDYVKKFPYSLYRDLVTKDSFALARRSLGYWDVVGDELMEEILSKPYIDISVSFKSLIPNEFSNIIKKKLLKFYLNKIKDNPFYHDKVEFHIVLSAFDLNFSSIKYELLEFGFSENEILIIKNTLIRFTNNLFLNYSKYLEDDLKKLNKLELYLQKIKKNVTDDEELIKLVFNILKKCKENGIIPFARQARFAFISMSLLDSLVLNNVIESETKKLFFNSLQTITSQLQSDYRALITRNITLAKYYAKYGHLKPNLYEIDSEFYRTQPLNNFNTDDIHLSKIKKVFEISNKQSKTIDRALSRHGFLFNSKYYFDIAKKTIENREYFKFVFSKAISLVTTIITQLGSKYYLNKSDLDYLSIFDYKKIFLNAHLSYSQKRSNLLKCINKNKKIHESINLALPPLVFKESDFYFVENIRSIPNFITKKFVEGTTVLISKNIKQNKIRGKIVLVEHADPGYDWIFTQSPLSIITKYGGAGSHLAIRCLGNNIPAVIGCGEPLFNKIISAKTLKVDCKRKSLEIVR